MQLEFSGAPEIAAGRAEVWRRLLDPAFVARSAPGVESVEAADPSHFKVVVALGVGMLKLRFTMQVELDDLVEPESARLRARGKAPGSTVDATTSFKLEALGPDRTKLNWDAVTEIGGTVASVGARLLEGTARKLTEEFWRDFAALVAEEKGKG
ncbi:MAG: carbon monoxide dehydrogenase subunit G [Gemmatimonadota bacterium]